MPPAALALVLTAALTLTVFVSAAGASGDPCFVSTAVPGAPPAPPEAQVIGRLEAVWTVLPPGPGNFEREMSGVTMARFRIDSVRSAEMDLPAEIDVAWGRSSTSPWWRYDMRVFQDERGVWQSSPYLCGAGSGLGTAPAIPTSWSAVWHLTTPDDVVVLGPLLALVVGLPTLATIALVRRRRRHRFRRAHADDITERLRPLRPYLGDDALAGSR